MAFGDFLQRTFDMYYNWTSDERNGTVVVEEEEHDADDPKTKQQPNGS